MAFVISDQREGGSPDPLDLEEGRLLRTNKSLHHFCPSINALPPSEQGRVESGFCLVTFVSDAFSFLMDVAEFDFQAGELALQNEPVSLGIGSQRPGSSEFCRLDLAAHAEQVRRPLSGKSNEVLVFDRSRLEGSRAGRSGGSDHPERPAVAVGFHARQSFVGFGLALEAPKLRVPGGWMGLAPVGREGDRRVDRRRLEGDGPHTPIHQE